MRETPKQRDDRIEVAEMKRDETPTQQSDRLEAIEHRRIERLNRFRTSPFGVALFYGYLIAILLSGLLAGKAIIDNSRISREAHRGICTLKIEREKRVKQTEAILLHPNNPENKRIIATFGKPLLVRSLESAKADEDALKDVSC